MRWGPLRPRAQHLICVHHIMLPPAYPDPALRDEVPQPVRSVAPEQIEGFRLDLADALARHAQFSTDLFEGAGVFAVQAEPLPQDLSLARRQDRKSTRLNSSHG